MRSFHSGCLKICLPHESNNVLNFVKKGNENAFIRLQNKRFRLR